MKICVGFASDLHLGHIKASINRGYASVEEHDRAVIDKLKSQCNKRTLLWVLGDVAMRPQSLQLLAEVPGQKRLVRGNHDQYDLAEYLKYFSDVHGILKYKNMWLSHCPIHPQEMYRCKLNVHGHIHKNSNSPEIPLPYFNVNWDFWGRAVSLDEIAKVRDSI